MPPRVPTTPTVWHGARGSKVLGDDLPGIHQAVAEHDEIDEIQRPRQVEEGLRRRGHQLSGDLHERRQHGIPMHAEVSHATAALARGPEMRHRGVGHDPAK
jgi:hypothetical protein